MQKCEELFFQWYLMVLFLSFHKKRERIAAFSDFFVVLFASVWIHYFYFSLHVSYACKMVLWLAVLAMPVAIFSTTLLYIVGPVVLFALLFFNLTFIALGSNYIPTEELLDKEEENNGSASAKYMRSLGGIVWFLQ